jgi:hypothetical protein
MTMLEFSPSWNPSERVYPWWRCGGLRFGDGEVMVAMTSK